MQVKVRILSFRFRKQCVGQKLVGEGGALGFWLKSQFRQRVWVRPGVVNERRAAEDALALCMQGCLVQSLGFRVTKSEQQHSSFMVVRVPKNAR